MSKLAATAMAPVLSLVLAGGCAIIDPHGIVARRAPAGFDPPAQSAPLGRETRMAAIDFVWNTVNERYYDPKFNGVDWVAARGRWQPRALAAADDEAFWDDLDHMTGELRDAHTRVESPRRAALIESDRAVTIGFSLQLLEGRLTVTRVRADGDAYWAGVRPGMALAQIEGRPALAAYQEALAVTRQSSSARARHRTAVRKLLDGDPGTLASFVFVRADDSRIAAKLRRESIATPARVSHRLLPSGLGYVRLSSWDDAVQDRMISAIASLRDAPGIVVDLRGNPGGSAAMVRRVAEQFFQGKVAAGRAITRTGKPVTLAAFELVKLRQELDGEGTYGGPVVVLVDEGSASGSELFAGLLQSLGRAKVVGRTTCGCLLAFLGYANTPGGGKLAYSEVAFEFPDGRRIEGEGVVPDVPVEMRVADLLAARDRALEEAQRLLAQEDLVHEAPRR